MEALLNLPVLVKVFVSFFFIIAVTRLLKSLLLALAGGTVILALWAGHSLWSMAAVVWKLLTSVNNLFLIIIVILVIILSRQMEESGIMRDMVKRIKSRLSQKFSMAALPAIIGLLPMPGGALFSAPLVDDCDDKKIHPPLLKTQINYWFRHIWEFWWPLYPGVLVALAQSRLPFWEFALLQIPLSIFSIAGGYVFFLRKISPVYDHEDKPKDSFIVLLVPIFVIITVYAVLKIFFPPIEKISTYLPMTIGILFAIIILELQKPLPFSVWKKILWSRKILNMALIVLFIRIYGAFIESRLPGGGLLMETMRFELDSLGVPIFVLVIAVAFISGITTGLAVGFVGASFPIVMSILGQSPQQGLLLSTVVLAYGFGYVGMLLSPVHVCLIVTNEYFKTNLFHSISSFIRPAAFILAGTLILSILPQFIFGSSIWN
ncbi:MAG: DUF401 family protein [Spirochaetales bacterium]|nr:MAG: DUF401 family protein [Spirochaetales bacterium]